MEQPASPTEKLKALFGVASAYVCQQARAVNKHLVRSMRTAALLVVALSPAACMPSWENPNMPAGQWDQVKLACAQEAAYKVPPRISYVLEPASAFSTEDCGKHGCTKYSSYTPPQEVAVDTNAPVREQIDEQCLVAHGGVKHGL